MRRIVSVALLALLVVTVVPTSAEAATPKAPIYQLQSGNWSPQVEWPSIGGGTCNYRIIFGNYGSVPYMTMRMYKNSLCAPAFFGLVYQDGKGFHYKRWNTGTLQNGTDGCGAYVSFTGSVNTTAYGVGAYWDTYPEPVGVTDISAIEAYKDNYVIWRRYAPYRGGAPKVHSSCS